MTQMNLNFSNRREVYALREVLRADMQALGGLLTRSESNALKEQLNVMCNAPSAGAAEAAYNGYVTMLSAKSGNSFSVETLVQKTDVPASMQTEQALRSKLKKLKARVDYLSKFGKKDGNSYVPYLTVAQTDLLRAYLDRAESRLTFYADKSEGAGLTELEATEVQKALSGTAESGNPTDGAEALIESVLHADRLDEEDVNFTNRSNVSALRLLLFGEMRALSSELTRSENSLLGSTITKISLAPSVEAAKASFNAFLSILAAKSNNSFKVETLVQKTDLAPASNESVLRNKLNVLKARVEYLSQFGQPGGNAYLTAAQSELLKGYLDRAENRLKFYASQIEGAGLTVEEAYEVERALTGIAEPGDPPGGATMLMDLVLDDDRLSAVNVDFANVSNVAALQAVLIGNWAVFGGNLTSSEKAALERQLNLMRHAQSAAVAETAFNDYVGLLAEKRGNSFKVETLVQLGGTAASGQIEKTLRCTLTKLKARVDYLSKFGLKSGGATSAYLTPTDTELLRAYIERAESRLTFYATRMVGVGLTSQEVTRIQNALDGIAEPGDPSGGAANLVANILNDTRLAAGSINFADRSNVNALGKLLQGEMDARGAALTPSESASLREQIVHMRCATSAAMAEAAFSGFLSMLTAKGGNAFKVETLAQKGGAAASPQAVQSLYNKLIKLSARVEYLQRYGGNGGSPFLSLAQVELLNGYLDRAEGRLSFYANGVGLTTQEVTEINKALDGKAEPGDPAGGAEALIAVVLANGRLAANTVDFGNRSNIAALRTVLSAEMRALGSVLTPSENASLNDKLKAMCFAPTEAESKSAYADFLAMRSAKSGNSFKVETLVQKTDGVAPMHAEQDLRSMLTKLSARVDYLSRFGLPGGDAYLTPAQSDLIRGYLDRASNRLTYYANHAGGVGLTISEVTDIQKALTGTAETGDPAGGAVNLISQVLADARLGAGNVDFANLSNVTALRKVLQAEMQAMGGLLTASETATLNGQLKAMCFAPTSALAKAAYADYLAMRLAKGNNSFKVETLVQKTDVAAPAQAEAALRGSLAKLKARVDFLSKLGVPGGGAYLTSSQTDLLRAYLDRAESRLSFYATQVEGLRLTALEVAEINKALTGTPEVGDPPGGSDLIAEIMEMSLA